MSKPKQVNLPNPLRNPLIVLETVADLKEMVDAAKKESADAGRQLRDRRKFQRIDVFLKELEAVSEARAGDQI